MVMAFTSGPTEVFIKEIGIKTRYQAMVNITGMMGEHIKVTGSTIICMVKVSTNGPMVVNTRVSTSTIRSMVMESTLIQTVDLTKDSGQMENSTVRVYSSLLKVHKEKVSGMRAKGLSGSMRRIKRETTSSICNSSELI